MKIFAIRDELDPQKKNLAYLFCYERQGTFYIELPEDADPWETPLILSSFLKRGERTVNAYWSKIWVQQRVVPPDRQNLGQILRDNGIKTYNELDLLEQTQGRCTQDDYYLVQIERSDLPDSFIQRFERQVEDVVPLSDFCLLVFFRGGEVKRCDVEPILQANRSYHPILKSPELFQRSAVETGGHGVRWGDEQIIPCDTLYTIGERIPLSLNDFVAFSSQSVINTREAMEILDCSRQNIDDHVRHGRLHPIKKTSKNTLFLKSEVTSRLWGQR